MEKKIIISLSSTLRNMWEQFSDSADSRKEIDRYYGNLLKDKKRLYNIYIQDLSEEEREIVAGYIEDINNFYHKDSYATWEDYEKKANELDRMCEYLDRLEEKLDNMERNGEVEDNDDE